MADAKEYTNFWYNEPKTSGSFAVIGGTEKAKGTAIFSETYVINGDDFVTLCGYCESIENVRKAKTPDFKFIPQPVAIHLYKTGNKSTDFTKWLGDYLATKYPDKQPFYSTIIFGSANEKALRALADPNVEDGKKAGILMNILETESIDSLDKIKDLAEPEKPANRTYTPNGGTTITFLSPSEKFESLKPILGFGDDIKDVFSLAKKTAKLDLNERESFLSLIKSLSQ